MTPIEPVDIDHEGAKAAAGFKAAAIVVVIGLIASGGELWPPDHAALPPVDGMRAEFFSAGTTYTPAPGTAYSPSPDALQAMESATHIESF